MAVTSPSRTDQDSRRSREERPERETDEPRAEDAPQAQAEEEESTEQDKAPAKSRSHIWGAVLAFAALAIYFIWLGKEMGGATPDGEGELAAVFVAILIAVVALVAGVLLGGRSRDN
jgi:hypothetical protein